MQDPHSTKNDFINKVTEIIIENISNEQFGVSELARKVGMSRSNLLRKVKKLTKLSASQFIREVRLKKAMEMLKQDSLNVSEITFEVGFSSTSYFIKCFKDYYGYSPGEAVKREKVQDDTIQVNTSENNRKPTLFIVSIIVIIIATVVTFLLFKPISTDKKEPVKSIAVLPFINDSNDSTNVYIINGLMETILNKLQNIEDLRVVSRTSVEKYRNTTKTISEIAKELNVNYFVEGSGQKIGDQILLNIQLIEASSDDHMWSEQYNREAKDIFKLQQEVAKSIANEIQVIITPAEADRINKVPTDNLVAYDYFLKGLDFMRRGNREELEEAIACFNKALEKDNEFALVYAHLAISYYYLDIYQVNKKYLSQLNQNADKALLFDPKLPQSLVAKALYYINNAEFEMAVPYLEKALEYNPNSALVINILSDFYTSYIPDTEKYLEYALKGISLDIAANDSSTISYIYLHLSNALIQVGFIEEAEIYINKSLDYNPDNLYSEYVKAYILYAKNRNLNQTKDLLLKALSKDTTRLDIMQEVGKIYYYLRDYDSAYKYYKRFINIKNDMNLDIYKFENAKIGVVYDKVGLRKESEKLFEEYFHYVENDESVYKNLSYAVYYSYHGETKKAFDHLYLFSQQKNYHYWIILFLKIDPLVDNLKDLPEYKKIIKNIEKKFWKNHKRIETSLKEKELI